MEDNDKLRKAQTQIENCAKDEAELNEKLSGVNMEMLGEKEELISKQTKIFREKSEIQGLLKELHVKYILSTWFDGANEMYTFLWWGLLVRRLFDQPH